MRPAFPALLAPFILLALVAAFFLLMSDRGPATTVPWTFGFFAMLVAYALTFADLRLGLGLMLAAIGLSPDVGVGGVSLRLEDFLIPVIGLAWASRVVVKHEPLATTDLKGPILAFLFVSAVAGVNGAIFFRSDPESTPYDRVFFFLKQLEYFLLFLLVINIVKALKEVKVYLGVLLVVSAAIGLYGYVRGIEGEGDRFTAMSGETANILGGYMFFNIAIAVGMFLTTKSFRLKAVLVAYAVMMLYPFLITLSRSSWIAALAGMTVLGVMRQRRILLGIAILVVLIPAVSPDEVQERITSMAGLLTGKLPPSMQARIEGVIYHGTDFVRFPVLGKGPGATPLGDLDNEYARVAVDTGVLGLLAFFWLLWRMLRLSYRAIDDAREDPELSGFALGYFAGMVGMMVHALAATSFMTIRTMEPIMFTTGLLVVVQNHYALRDRPVPGAPGWAGAPRLRARVAA